MAKINFDELPQAEQNILTQIYGSQGGYTFKKIAYVEELSAEEQTFFDRDNFLSPNFFVQRLYKVAGNFLPLKFNLAVNKLIEGNDSLRTNFCAVDTRTLKIVFESRRELPEIVYRNLTGTPDIDAALKNVMEADMRRSFDVRRDNLTRFAVFHTGEDEYAILITLPKIIQQSFEVKNLFRAVFDLPPLPETKKFAPKFDAVPEPIQKYWTNILQDLPPMPALPFAKTSAAPYLQRAYKISIPAALMSDLRQKANSNKMMLMAIFQAAWAILLQSANNSQDVTFSTLVPDRNSEDINSIPVRFKSDNADSVQNLVTAQFKQILISKPYAVKNFSVIKKILRAQNKTFEHFLSFGDFMLEEKLYSETGATADGELVLQNSWNSQNTKLALYFDYKDDSVSISILYDANKFLSKFGEKLSRRFYLTLQQMILDWNLNYKNFMTRLSDRFSAEGVEQVEDTNFLLNFISQLGLLQGESLGSIQQLAKISTLKTFFEGDRISGADIEQNIIFVASGKLVRSIDAGDGWYNTLDILKENRWLNENALLENRKTKISAEVLTERASLMFVSIDAFKKFLRENFSVEQKILRHVLGEMEKYQRLWVNA